MARALRTVPILALALFGAFSIGAQEGTALRRSNEDLRLFPPGAGARFRFLPSESWLDFDRGLFLTAAPGEERLYVIETEFSGVLERRSYLIDRRAPGVPGISAPTGVYESALGISLSGEPGSTLRYGLAGPAVAMDFRAFDPTRPLRLVAPDSGSASWTLVAIAEDEVGNRSYPAQGRYILTSPGLKADDPLALSATPQARTDPLPEVFPPEERRKNDRIELLFQKPREGRLLAAVNAGPGVGRPECYAPLPESDGRLLLALDAPYGWAGEFTVHLAVEAGGSLRYRPEPYRFRLDQAPADSPPPAPPPSPLVLAGPPGSASYLVFPPYGGRLLVTMAGQEEQTYRDPLPIAPGAGTVSIAWRAFSNSGLESGSGRIEVPRPPLLPGPDIRGLDGPMLSNTPRRLGGTAGRFVRYELSQDGRIPPEPTSRSPLLGSELLLDCPEGELRNYVFRYRPFSGSGLDALGGDSTLAAFVIDRQPPLPPVLKKPSSVFSRDSLRLELTAPEGQIFIALSTPGGESAFLPYRGPLELRGSAEGPVEYRLRAYVEDAAGNRSPEIGPLRFTVDTASLYVDASASPGGSGGPEDPLRDLAAAVDEAIRSGRPWIRLRGVQRLSRPLVIESAELRILGCSGPDWRTGTGLATLELPAPKTGASPLTLRDSRVRLEGLTLSASAGEGHLLDLRGGRMELVDSALSGDSISDLILVNARDGELLFRNSRLGSGGRGRAAFVAAERVVLSAERSSFFASGALDYLTGIDAANSRLALDGCLVTAQASLGVVGLSLKDAEIIIDRSAFSVSGGPGFLRLGRATRTNGEIRNSRIELSGEGSALLFDLDAAALAFVHDTAIVRTSSLGARFFDARGSQPSFTNSVFYAPGGAATFLSAEIEGTTISSCAFGGFLSYLSGPAAIGDLQGPGALPAQRGASPNLVFQPAAFVADPKRGLVPSRSAPFIDAAMPLPGEAYAQDYLGRPRPSSFGKRLPDIGADEYAE